LPILTFAIVRQTFLSFQLGPRVRVGEHTTMHIRPLTHSLSHTRCLHSAPLPVAHAESCTHCSCTHTRAFSAHPVSANWRPKVCVATNSAALTTMRVLVLPCCCVFSSSIGGTCARQAGRESATRVYRHDEAVTRLPLSRCLNPHLLSGRAAAFTVLRVET
jgi:hypothetical protein